MTARGFWVAVRGTVGTLLAIAAGLVHGQVAPSPESAGGRLLQNLAPDPLIEPMAQVLRQDPTQAGTWLDLAVALCQRQRGDDARRVLLHIERTLSPPDGIREIIRLLRNEPCDSEKRPIRVQVGIHRGVDDNVNQGASTQSFELGSAFPGVVLTLSDEFLPQSDQLMGLDASVAWSPANGWLLTGQLRQRTFDRLSAYNSLSGVFSVDREWNCAAWRCGLGLSLGGLQLAGRPYQRLAALQWGVQTPVDALGQQWTAELGVARQHFPRQSAQSAVVATARAGWRRQLPSGAVWQAGLNLGGDWASGLRPGGRRTLYGASASLHQPLPWRLSLESSVTAQKSLDTEIYSPGLIDAVRKPLVTQASLALVRPINGQQRVRLEFRQATSRDTVSVFSYRSRGVNVSWIWRGDF